MQHVQLFRLLLLLLVSCCNKLYSTCSFGWGCHLLVAHYGIVFQSGERLFYSRCCYSSWWAYPWRGYHRGNFISYLPLETLINFGSFVHPTILLGHLLDLFVQPKSFEDIFWIFCPHQIFLGYPLVLFIRPNLSMIFWTK